MVQTLLQARWLYQDSGIFSNLIHAGLRIFLYRGSVLTGTCQCDPWFAASPLARQFAAVAVGRRVGDHYGD
jgi:hypothetical protein